VKNRNPDAENPDAEKSGHDQSGGKQQSTATKRRRSFFSVPAWIRVPFVFGMRLFALYMPILLLGLIPVNNDFTQSKADDAVEIYLVSNAVHSDILVPVADPTMDWRELFPASDFPGPTGDAPHVAIGWGDKGFYLHTPTWAELKLSTALNALFVPSDCCVHVQFTYASYYPKRKAVKISRDQYRQLVQYILGSLTDRDEPAKIGGYHYGRTDAFYEAKGNYHALNTCNSWVGRGLKQIGVRTPWLAPLPGTPAMYLPGK